MTRATVTAGAAIAALAALVLGLAVRYGAPAPDVPPAAVTAASPPEAAPGFIYGRIQATDGTTYEGRLRWGGSQEAFWGDYFDGRKPESPWAKYAPRGPENHGPRLEIFGLKIGGESDEFARPFMTRFGDIARLEAYVGQVRVTLKSGTVLELNRFEAGDIDDGVRVWDRTRGMVDLDAREIRTIQFLPAPPLAGAPERLHGTVRTRQGAFTGFIQWDREDGIGADELEGDSTGGEVTLRYDTIQSIARHSRDSALVTLRDGREMVVSGSNGVSRGNRIYVEDARYGRVLIDWDVFERVEFTPGGSGPGYTDFPPGRPLTGSVDTGDGRRLAGRLVFDFDESETTETLDAPADGLTYHLTLGLVRSIVPNRGAPRATVRLLSGEELHLDRRGDLGEQNAGLLIFADGRQQPEYVPWSEVEQIELDK